MDLRIERKWKKDTYTIGNLYYKENDSDEWKFICNTLEDKDRGLDCMMSDEEIKAKKVYGKTAIPTGKYRVFLRQVSPRFQYSSWAKPYEGRVPRIMNVKGFDGVLIHPGNKPEDTLGCVLLGENKVKGGVINSQLCFHKFMDIVKRDEDGMLGLEII